MKKFNNSIWISRPVQDVFTYFTDVNKLAKGIKNVVSIEKITESSIGIGTELKYTFMENDEQNYSIIEVEDFIEQKKISFKNIRERVQAIYTYNFTNESNGTIVELIAEIEFDGLDDAIADRIFETIKNEDYDQLEGFKKVIEE